MTHIVMKTNMMIMMRLMSVVVHPWDVSNLSINVCLNLFLLPTNIFIFSKSRRPQRFWCYDYNSLVLLMKVQLEKPVASKQIKPSMPMFKKYVQQNQLISVHTQMYFFQTMKNIVSIALMPFSTILNFKILFYHSCLNFRPKWTSYVCNHKKDWCIYRKRWRRKPWTNITRRSSSESRAE